MGRPILQIRDLVTEFTTGEEKLRAVDGLSLDVTSGEVVGLVGESGCGKSAAALSVLRLIPPDQGRIASGEIIFEGIGLSRLSEKQMRGLRGNRIGMVFQEPMTSLNPVLTIGDQIVEVLRLHRGLRGAEAKRAALEALARVRIASPEQRLLAYPHQLSGGMRQRAMLAMALACEPALLIADEPTTALDVTVQAEILALLGSLSESLKLAVLLITHDLTVVSRLAAQVVIVYAGQVVEQGPTAEVLAAPLHPYTAALLRALPKAGARQTPLDALPPAARPVRDEAGCRFAPRCSIAQEKCNASLPDLLDVERQADAAEAGVRRVRCFTPLFVAEGGD